MVYGLWWEFRVNKSVSKIDLHHIPWRHGTDKKDKCPIIGTETWHWLVYISPLTAGPE